MTKSTRPTEPCLFMPNGDVKFLLQLSNEDNAYVSDFQASDLETATGAIKIARLTLRDSLCFWDKTNREIATLPLDRFFMDQTYSKGPPSVPEEFIHRYPLNELRSEIIEEQVVNEEVLKTATSAEKKALFDYCADHGITVPNDLNLFMKNIGQVPIELIDSERSKLRDKALFWAVANVKDLTGLPVALNDKWLGLEGVGCAVEAVYEAMKHDLGQHVRLKPGTIKKAYERVNRHPATVAD